MTREFRALLVALALIGAFGVTQALAEEPGPDGRSCAETRGNEYLSWAERDWYLSSCIGVRLTAFRAPTGVSEHLARIRWCESRDDYGAISPNGWYFGSFQFDRRTFNDVVGRAGYPEYVGTRPDYAPPYVQDAAAVQLYRERGGQPWPVCRWAV
jgi:hypothetical protein